MVPSVWFGLDASRSTPFRLGIFISTRMSSPLVADKFFVRVDYDPAEVYVFTAVFVCEGVVYDGFRQ